MENVLEKTTADSDSQSSREQSHENFSRFLKKLGVESMPASEKVEWLKNIDYDKFMDLLSVANGLLTAENDFQRWEGKTSRSIVAMAGGSPEDATLDPPKDAEQEFRRLFDEMQNEISDENLKKWAAKIYVGIIFSHMFEDGNGRTGRNIYQLMSTENIPDAQISIDRGVDILEFCNRVSLNSMTQCFRQEGIPVEQILDTQEYYTTQNGIQPPGNMSHLQYLAARRTLMQIGGEVSAKIIELSDVPEGQKKVYEEEYETLKKKWWWGTQKTVDNYENWAVGSLDKATLKKDK